MSTVSGGALCVALNQYLEELAGKSAPNRRRTKTGFLDSLVSPLNTNDQLKIAVDQGNGQRKSVKVQYYQRQTQSEVLTDYPANCNPTNSFALQETDFDISLKSVIGKKLESEYVAKICAGNSWAFNQVIAGMFEAMQREINEQLITAASTQFGINVATGAATVNTIDIFDNTNGKIKPAEWLQLMDELQNSNQFQAPPIIVAGSTMSKVNNLANVGCCNDAGADMQALTNQLGYSFFNDQMIDTTLGANEAIVVEPGSAQFVTWMKYRNLGDALRNDGAYAAWQDNNGTQAGILRDPVTGMMYNFKVIFDSCDDLWKIFLELNYDLWVTPTDAYDAADHMTGYNGLLYYKFT